MGQLGLQLITGPANAGKVALLLRRSLEAVADEPYLIVPNRSDVERVERDLLELQPALLGGSIGTFDDLFRQIARGGGDVRQVATEAQRALIVRRALAGRSLNGLGRSARFGGFADALLSTVAELESGLLDPNDLDGELSALYGAYRAELDRLGLWDQDLRRRHAAELVASDLDAWSGEPVFAYGVEDLTGAGWALLPALAGPPPVAGSPSLRAGPRGAPEAAGVVRPPRKARLRPGPARPAAVRVAGWDSGGSVCVPEIAVLGVPPPERRFPRRPAARARRRQAGAGRGRDDPPA